MPINNVTVIRYVRPLLGNGHYSNLGGITFLFELDYTRRTINIYFSVCSSKENFNKKEGIEIAKQAGIERQFNYDKFQQLATLKGGFVDAYISILESEQVMGVLTKRESILLKKGSKLLNFRQ